MMFMPKTKYIFYFALLSIFMARTAVSEDLDVEFVYNANGLPDPFVPLITDKMAVKPGLVGIESIEDIQLEGIVWDPTKESMVILNGMIVRENEEVNNIKLIEIKPTSIRIMIENEVYTIELIKDEEGRIE